MAMTYILAEWTLSDDDQTELEIDVHADADGNAEITGIRILFADGRWHDISDAQFKALKAQLLNTPDFWTYLFRDRFPEAEASARELAQEREYA